MSALDKAAWQVSWSALGWRSAFPCAPLRRSRVPCEGQAEPLAGGGRWAGLY